MNEVLPEQVSTIVYTLAVSKKISKPSMSFSPQNPELF
jgi:hypothetical protein